MRHHLIECQKVDVQNSVDRSQLCSNERIHRFRPNIKRQQCIGRESLLQSGREFVSGSGGYRSPGVDRGRQQTHGSNLLYQQALPGSLLQCRNPAKDPGRILHNRLCLPLW